MKPLPRLPAVVLGLLLLSFLCWRGGELILPQASVGASRQLPVTLAKPPAANARVPEVSRHPVLSLSGPAVAASAPRAMTEPSLPPATPAAGEPPLSEETIRQIAALLEEKERRSDSEGKVDSKLLLANQKRQGLPAPGGAPLEAPLLSRDADGRILTDIKAEVSDVLLQNIADRGGLVVNHFAKHRAIRAWLPLAEVPGLAERPEIAFIMPAVRAVTHKTNTSLGDAAHKGPTARSTYAATGSGVKVGVLSDSVDFLSTVKASGDLPSSVTILSGQSGSGAGEGTAMLEIVYDLAPGSQLYFATAFTSAASFAENIRALHAAGCRVIIDDVGYMDQSPFQDDVIARAVNEVTAAGSLYFSAAGNEGNKNDGTSGCWEGDFVQGGTMSSGGTARPIHRFGSLTYNVLSGTDGRADLFWADPIGASSNDYDLFILNSSGSVVASSTNRQTGSQDPYEYVDTVANGGRIVVMKYAGADRFLHLDTGDSTLSVSTDGTTRGQSCAADAFCVAAVDVATASSGPFVGGTKNPVETFSSDGRRRMFFNADGTAITPGNFSSAGGTLRSKPDLAAADGVACATSGFNPFFGTSAAAPHAGAIAALLRSYNTGLSPTEYRNLMLANTLDIEAAGADRDSGTGIVMADKVLAAAPTAQTPTITGFAPTSGAIGQSVVITGTKLTGVTAVSFNNTAAASFTVNSATQITATVPTGATTGVLKVTNASGTGTSATSFTILSTPVIASLTPASGNIGTSVVLAGSFFTGATSVKFNGTAATAFTVNSASQITATVPTGATTGRVTVTVGALTATSPENFTVTTLPVISSLSPVTGGVGSSVVFNGANLTGATAVKFNITAATTFTVNSASRITATVPAGATTGTVSVTTSFGTGTGPTFTVVPTPTLTGFTPASASAGAQVTLTGTNLTGTTSITFGGIPSLSFTVTSATQVVATVPAGAASGLISLTTPGGTVSTATSFTLIAPPANDAFANAQTLPGAAGSLTGTNVAASRETGEPSHAGNVGGRSVWFKWTAPVTMAVRFTTAGSTFDTLLGAYTGSAVGALATVASNDNTDGVVTTSSVSWVAVSGTTYYLAVDGRSAGAGSAAASGPLTLAWSGTTVPLVTSFTPTAGVAGTTVTLTGANFTGTTAVEFNGVAATFTVTNATTISATVPAGATTGNLTVTSANGAAVSPGTFTVQAVLANDLFANAQVITGASGTISASSDGASKETGEPSHGGRAGGKSVWFRWTSPVTGTVEFHTASNSFDTLLGVYTGTAVNALATIASNDDTSSSITASQVSFNATSGTVYRIAVDGYSAASGTFSLVWSSGTTVPTLTGFTPSQGSPGTSVVLSGTNLSGATSVTFGGVPATVFAVNSATQITATVPAAAVTGVITVTTPSGSATSAEVFTLVVPPTNDTFAGAQNLGNIPAVFYGNSANATKETGEPTHVGATPGKSVWFRWTAPSSGTWTISSSGSAYDTVLAVYTGTSVSALTLVASDDDNGDGNTSTLTLNATAGVTYSIALDGLGGATGAYFLRVLPVTGPQTVYKTGFEAVDGFSLGNLSGQQGWSLSGTGGNTIAAGLFATGGRQARVGLTAPTDITQDLFVWKPLDHTPDLANRPLVRFSVDLAIIDSSTTNYDTFYWSLYNKAGDLLVSFYFDNSTLGYGYYDAAGTAVSVGQFANGTIYPLEVLMDFANNRFTATLNGAAIATNATLAAAGKTLDLGDIDAAWSILGSAAGNNYMAFDNYTVTAETGGLPSIVVEPQGATVNVGAAVTLAVGATGTESLSYQWRFNGNNLTGQTAPTLALTSLQAGQTGDYSVVVTNTLGTDTSLNARVTVVTPSALPTWTAEVFPGVSDTAITGPTADPDRDGQTNFAEFAFGSSPTSPVPAAGLPRAKSDGSGLTFWRRQGAGAPTYEVQTSATLTSWSVSAETPVIVTDAAAPAGYERVEVSLPAGTRGFVRLVVKE